MGYGIKNPGIWNGKSAFTWKFAPDDDPAPADIEAALSAWGGAVGITFTRCKGVDASADFTVVTGASQSSWHEARKTLNFRGTPSVGTALHEVGHLLGLSHEHDRADSRETFYAADTARGGFGLEGAVGRAAKLQNYGAYDLDSVMQYPESNYVSKLAPSAGDVESVKAINGW